MNTSRLVRIMEGVPLVEIGLPGDRPEPGPRSFGIVLAVTSGLGATLVWAGVEDERVRQLLLALKGGQKWNEVSGLVGPPTGSTKGPDGAKMRRLEGKADVWIDLQDPYSVDEALDGYFGQ